MDQDIPERIKQLQDKYAAMGQDLKSYLDGLLTSNYLTYWEYIHLDTLLSLQTPKTDFPDENIFIMYHQITELYFKLALLELKQIVNNGRNVLPNGEDMGWKDALDKDYFVIRLTRVNEYFRALTTSFGIMIKGMEKEQFLRFRMSLLPASGFQSAQYRTIEIYCTDFKNLVAHKHRKKYPDPNSTPISAMFEDIYWKSGATELATGKKTLTLKQFEIKYSEDLIELGEDLRSKNIWRKYKSLSKEDQQSEDIRQALRQLDVNVNVNWPLVHYKTAASYLMADEKKIAATGGTNWQKYLPPRFQKRIFYPELWSENELEEWGKGWVEKVFADRLTKHNK